MGLNNPNPLISQNYNCIQGFWAKFCLEMIRAHSGNEFVINYSNMVYSSRTINVLLQYTAATDNVSKSFLNFLGVRKEISPVFFLFQPLLFSRTHCWLAGVRGWQNQKSSLSLLIYEMVASAEGPNTSLFLLTGAFIMFPILVLSPSQSSPIRGEGLLNAFNDVTVKCLLCWIQKKLYLWKTELKWDLE